MVCFFNLFYSVCPCLSFILSVLVTNKRTYNLSLKSLTSLWDFSWKWYHTAYRLWVDCQLVFGGC